jgi:hypothetical protein
MESERILVLTLAAELLRFLTQCCSKGPRYGTCGLYQFHDDSAYAEVQIRTFNLAAMLDE